VRLYLPRPAYAPTVLVIGYALLVLAWAVANPPFAAPDEDGHYVRAVGLATGDIRGVQTRVALTAATPSDLRTWYMMHPADVRAVRVPGGLMASGVTCEALRPEASAGCLKRAVTIENTQRLGTLVATYAPFPYVVPGLAARLGSSPFAGLRLGRLAAATLCLALLALAAALAWDPVSGVTSLLGVVVATTPMVVFLSATVNPSGLEIASAIAFVTALLRLSRGPARPWVWFGAGLSGAALALSRAPGVVWLLLDLLLAVALVGVGRARALAIRGGRAAALAAAVVAVAAVASLGWSVLYGPEASVGIDEVARRVKHAVGVLPLRFREEVGQFGWLDTPMPTLAVMAWEAMIVALIAFAYAFARRRERWLLVTVTAAAIALPVAFSAWFIALTVISEAQGRHVLPGAVALPLLAGELLVRNRERLRDFDIRGAVRCAFVVAAAIQLIAWTWNAHRFAVGSGGPKFFFRAPEWSPPLGWWTWAIVASLGALTLAAASMIRAPDDRGADYTRRTRSAQARRSLAR
jgi:hypothetical protein